MWQWQNMMIQNISWCEWQYLFCEHWIKIQVYRKTRILCDLSKLQKYLVEIFSLYIHGQLMRLLNVKNSSTTNCYFSAKSNSSLRLWHFNKQSHWWQKTLWYAFYEIKMWYFDLKSLRNLSTLNVMMVCHEGKIVSILKLNWMKKW